MRSIPKVIPQELYYSVLSLGEFSCDKPSLTPSDKNFGDGELSESYQGVIRENSVRADCVIRSISDFSLTSPCSLSDLSLR